MKKGGKMRNSVSNKLVFLLILSVIVSCSFTRTTYEKTDDWEYSPDKMEYLNGMGGGPMTTSAPSGGVVRQTMSFEEQEDALGFSVGGAKDINNFRDNIENDFLPIPTDITVEGIYYDYYFDTGQDEPCEGLFCPSYSYAVSKDPFTGEEIYYLAVGLNSGLKESDFERKKLNLIIVLDISGSMSSPFDEYYYDSYGNMVEVELSEEDRGRSKMEIAREAIVDLLGHLEEEDRFGMVLFDDQGYLAKPMRLIAATDMESIKEHIMELEPMGGTNMSAGMSLGTELFGEYLNVDKEEYENRIIFLTDAMPNIGETSETGLLGMLSKNSEEGIYTTFIGIGLDFSTELTEYITKTKGANYYSVHSTKEFSERMDEGFEYMVTPLVFGLELVLEAEGYDIEEVYGSPSADEATGEIMNVSTLFPSRTEGGETKGGLVLLRLRKTSEDANIVLRVSYQDRSGEVFDVEDEVEFEVRGDGDYYQNDGIRKGILLARYVELMKAWLVDQRSEGEYLGTNPLVTRESGIVVFDERIFELGRWERQSMPLSVSSNYRELFEDFYDYFEIEIEAIGDRTLDRELDILKKLTSYK